LMSGSLRKCNSGPRYRSGTSAGTSCDSRSPPASRCNGPLGSSAQVDANPGDGGRPRHPRYTVVDANLPRASSTRSVQAAGHR
jgi:hypothetical protein